VVSIIARTQPFALEIVVLLVRPQSNKILGRNNDNKGAKSVPSPSAKVLKTSSAAPDNRVRSELIALMRFR